MNQTSQFGSWLVGDSAPCATEPNSNQLTLIYTDKKIQNIFEQNILEEFYIRKEKTSDYFLQHRTQIFYNSLVEISCFFHLPLLSRPENQIHHKINKITQLTDEGFTINLGHIQYVVNQDPRLLFNLEDRLSILLESSKIGQHKASEINQLEIPPVKQIVKQISTQTEKEIEDTLMLVNQHLSSFKNILFQTYSGQQERVELTLNDWLSVASCLQSLSIFKTGLIRQQVSHQQSKEIRLQEQLALQQQADYQDLQESRKKLLNGKAGPYIVADDNYPEQQHKGWPFARTLPMIERLHGLWNTRATLNDQTMYSKDQNRFDFDKALQMNEIVLDIGAGNGNCLRDIRQKYAHLDLYLVALGIDPLDNNNLSFMDEIWYMPLPEANHMPAFIQRFQGKVGLATCTFGATTYAAKPHWVAIMAAFLLRRGGHFSAVISSQPGHYDGTPLGYADDRQKLVAFLKKYLKMDAIVRPTSIESAVVSGAKPIDFKLDITRPLDAAEIPYTLQELLALADIEIGVPHKLKADPNHPYHFKSQTIEMNGYLLPGKISHNNILELGHIKQSLLNIQPIENYGLVFQINFIMDSVDALDKLYQKVNQRVVKYTTDQFLPRWSIEKNVLNEDNLTLIISYVDPASRQAALTGNLLQYFSFLQTESNEKFVKNAWINLIELLQYNGIIIPGVTEKIDSFQYPTLPDNIPFLASQANGELSTPSSFDHSLDIAFIPGPTEPHPETGEPVFSYYAIGRNPSVDLGCIKLYGTHQICRSPEGDRHNILYRDGIFANPEIDINKISQICESLPPTLLEKCAKAATEGVIHGVVRGVTNVLAQDFMTSAKNTTKILLKQGMYLSSMFTYHYWQSSQAADESESYYDIGYKALVKTGYFFLANTAVSALKLASKYAHNRQWAYTSDNLNRTSNLVRLSLFATNTISQGPIAAATSIVAGTTTQAVVELGGKKIAQTIKPKHA